MRISTSQLYDRPTSLMTQLTRQADSLQTQIATGSKGTSAASDAAAWRQLDTLKRADGIGTAHASNLKLAQGTLAQSDSVLASIETQLQRVQEVAIQAGNETLTPENRQSLSTTLQAIADDLFSLANTQDSRGQPLFGGAIGDAAYVRSEDGTISYAGQGDPAPIPIGENDNVHTSVTGDRAFGDMFSIVQALQAALTAGEGPGDAGEALKSTLDAVGSARASVGARAIRVDLVADRLTESATARSGSREAIDATDIPTAVAELQKTLTVLQATQASFTKLSQLSLFDYLR